MQESDICNISGIACLHAHASQLTTLKPHWATKPGLACDCLPSCDETEITVIKDVIISKKNKAKRKSAHVEMLLAYLPTERFKRNVVRSRLDLVVSVGGTTGLFVGASLLSFVELLFYFTVRFISNVCIAKRKQGENNLQRANIIPMEEILQDNENKRNQEILKGTYAITGMRPLYRRDH